MRASLSDQPLAPWSELARHEAAAGHQGQYGASACFVGTMRDLNLGEGVLEMTLEHYPGMTERHLERIAATAVERWGLIDCCVIHRYGRLRPGDPIVLIATWAAHRAEAFTACRYLIETLKTEIPLWKKERLADRERWVEE